MKKVILLVAVLLSTSIVCGAKFLLPMRIQSTIYLFPDNFPGQTLDQAIHNETVIEGDTIIVKGGTYPDEHLNVNRSIALRGGYQGPTILDGGGNGTVVDISAGNVTLDYFTVQHGEYGVHIETFNVSANDIILENNSIESNGNGISISNSSNNVLRNNNLTGNSYNFGVVGALGSGLAAFIQDIDPSNTINDRPVYYWVNMLGGTIPTNAGYVALVNSTNVAVENLSLVHNLQGILLAYTSNSAIENNSLSNNVYGIDLIASEHNEVINNNLTSNLVGFTLDNGDNNTIVCNDIAENFFGVWLSYSNNNTLYRNNFVDNHNPLFTTQSLNSFNSSREGNYWDSFVSYQGRDVDGDGIGDAFVYNGTLEWTNTTPYYGVDYHPLMEPWKMNLTFGVPRYGETYNFATLSNSTIASPNWNMTRQTIGFNITSGTAESINITIPRDWLDGPFEIELNGTKLESSGFSVNQDNVFSYIFLRYDPGTYMVKIIGTKVLGYLSGDINGDGTVDIYDAIILSGHFGQSDP